ncbi:MAG: hypothetical protein ABI921_02195 [Panacibacter sp.]
MKQKAIPGYRAMFGEPLQTYEEILHEMPSDVIMSIAAIINNELTAPVEYKSNQQRILNLLCRGFTQKQIELLSYHLNRLTNSGYNENATELFHRRYLIAIILREVKRNAFHIKYIPANGKDFQFLLAYLLIIDEENSKDRIILDESLKKNDEPFIDYRLLWTPNISQFQFNESVSPGFEMFKLFCFLKHALFFWRVYLKKYLNKFDLDTIGKITSSYKEIFNATEHYNPDVDFSKHVDINPKPDANVKHLNSLCINEQTGKNTTTLLDFKKHPLLRTADNKYRVIDANIFYKHIYKGPFFDLLKKTSLNEKIRFNEYSSEVSKKVLEEVCFTSILKTLYEDKGVIHFDDGSSSIPDCYYRKNDIIFLIEFKAYILKDEIIESPDFENIKNYIDENFIEKNNGKPKGIGQLINQIENIKNGKYEFDNDLYQSGINRYTIYPIICHNDFHFSLPGINEYVNITFRQKLDSDTASIFNIKNVTFINLDWLFDLSLRGGIFTKLAYQIDKYWVILEEKKESFKNRFSSDGFINTKSSFDEIYQSHFIQELSSVKEDQNTFTILLNNAGITQELLDEIV